MSRITDYILDMEDRGELIYDEVRCEYITPHMSSLAEEIERLEWEITSTKADLHRLQQEVVELEDRFMERGE
mgnify:FL=1